MANEMVGRDAIGIVEAVVKRNRETEWMLNLKTAYSYSLNKRGGYFRK